MQRRALVAALAGLPLVPALPAPASAAPSAAAGARPLTIVAPYQAGVGPDLILRPVLPRLQALLGHPVQLEHRPGDNTATGTLHVARSAPDGHTLVFAAGGTWVINPQLRPNLGYTALEHFTPVTIATEAPFMLCVNPDLVAASDLIALMMWLKQPGQRVSYASAGAGLAEHVLMELFKQSLRVEVRHEPQGGPTGALNAVIEGRVPMAFIGQGIARQPVAEGRLRAIMVTSAARSPVMPALPTALESGFRNFVVNNWFALMAPAGVPQAALARLHAAMAAALQDPQVAGALQTSGFRVVGNAPADAERYIRNELIRWKRVVDSSTTPLI